ncbi:putative guanine nucleotide-exchange factor SED4 [Trichinella spiralis]|uniref:putative guanine nucleotide-exchange factor SED4 n=1 Tax=Trichinella spiralis TaxID=6334 RepID=UPI0001EFD44C|nr:putative guanine nucleotide-exchange factor SED4 [Trichinella spiralis]
MARRLPEKGTNVSGNGPVALAYSACWSNGARCLIGKSTANVNAPNSLVLHPLHQTVVTVKRQVESPTKVSSSIIIIITRTILEFYIIQSKALSLRSFVRPLFNYVYCMHIWQRLIIHDTCMNINNCI